MKKYISCLLVLLALVLPGLVMEADAATIVDSGSCGENVTWTLDSDGLLTISGMGDMEDYWASGWYECQTKIRSAVIEDGITSIGDNAFDGCDNMISISIPDSVTRIGDSAFFQCGGLSSITIPDSVTRIGDYAFYGCTNLTNIMIGENVRHLGEGAFYYCTNLSGIWVKNENQFYSSDACGVLLNKDKSQLIAAPGAILGVYSIPDSVTSIADYAFSWCASLSNITIPEGVTDIGEGAFSYCTGLSSITLPASVTDIGWYAFSSCDSLSSITIPEGVTYIGGYAFSSCDSLSSITLPDSVTYIVLGAFNGCYNLTVVHYGGTEAQRGNMYIGDDNWDLEDAVWHYECSEGNCPNPFVDIAAGAYYYNPVLWAVDQNITNGTSAITFGPDATCTRGQIVTFLWRANGSPEPKSDSNPFQDVSSGDYFYKAVLWAVEKGITSGMGDGSFAPGAPCTRGQVATFLWRACGQPAPSGTNIFTDITPGAYYYDAVLWAVEQGITNGMGDGTFAPDAPCTRGQIVTFLYRAMA